MNSKSVTLAASFAALALALNVIRIPTIYWPGWTYHFSEIPIVIAFMLLGPAAGVFVGLINLVGQEILFPIGPVGVVAYPMGLLALLLMLFGIYCAGRIISQRAALGKPASGKMQVVYLITFAVIFRGGIMPFLTYGVMYHVLLPLVIGSTIPPVYVVTLVPSFFVYNITVPLYTVPIAYFVAKKISNLFSNSQIPLE